MPHLPGNSQTVKLAGFNRRDIARSLALTPRPLRRDSAARISLKLTIVKRVFRSHLRGSFNTWDGTRLLAVSFACSAVRVVAPDA